MQSVDRLIVAADFSTRDEIMALIDELRGSVGVVKIGLQAFIANGPSLVRDVVGGGTRVFLDLKLHDIPNTVQHAVAEASALGAAMLSVHATGGERMLRAAARDGLMVLGVTILTSLDERELAAIGFSGPAVDHAARLARLSVAAGLGGVVASPHEIASIRQACGAGLTIVTPGIRPQGSDSGDQRRTMTPAEAIRAGADYIVVGRPITGAENRRDAALRIVEEMDGARV
ncbi:MAG TPA: orotidine-5'-phosphate decarboxylase [Thermoanaerobaculia bacterium]|nr:orotidine-5'-phosphate decarboxylase [Thermoanaerobaculia bacterium]